MPTVLQFWAIIFFPVTVNFWAFVTITLALKHIQLSILYMIFVHFLQHYWQQRADLAILGPQGKHSQGGSHIVCCFPYSNTSRSSCKIFSRIIFFSQMYVVTVHCKSCLVMLNPSWLTLSLSFCVGLCPCLSTSQYWLASWVWGVLARRHPPSRLVSTTNTIAPTHGGECCLWTPWVRHPKHTCTIVHTLPTYANYTMTLTWRVSKYPTRSVELAYFKNI